MNKIVNFYVVLNGHSSNVSTSTSIFIFCVTQYRQIIRLTKYGEVLNVGKIVITIFLTLIFLCNSIFKGMS